LWLIKCLTHLTVKNKARQDQFENVKTKSVLTVWKIAMISKIRILRLVYFKVHKKDKWEANYLYSETFANDLLWFPIWHTHKHRHTHTHTHTHTRTHTSIVLNPRRSISLKHWLCHVDRVNGIFFHKHKRTKEKKWFKVKKLMEG